MSKQALKMINIVKDFPGVRALDHINFEANYGEVLALVGENGAGKSTLMKILSGVWPHSAYSGEIYIDGVLTKFTDTKDAQKNGVAIIYQELNLIPHLSVAENIFLDRQKTGLLGLINWNHLRSGTQKLIDQLEITGVNPDDIVKDLTVGKQQLIEIAKALSQKSRIIVFDEPTSALTDKEVDSLFKVINKLKNENVCMIYISHKMEELNKIADKIAILRDGKTIGNIEKINSININEVIKRMVGRSITEMYPKQEFKRGKKILEIKNMSVRHPFLYGERRVKNISFDVHEGEIFGIAGLMGSGRTELASAIFGALSGESDGEIFLHGKKLYIKSPMDAIDNGIALVTEDRTSFGLVLGQSVLQNITISSLNTIANIAGLINKIKERKVGEKYVQKLRIKTPHLDTEIDSLSGGNQQKVILSKWLNTSPQVLILDEPTRGIDVGAKVEIYDIMNSLVRHGVAVIMISSQLPEITGMCDRIMIMNEGRNVCILDQQTATYETIMEYCTGNYAEAAE